jgi:hypothetical protein
LKRLKPKVLTTSIVVSAVAVVVLGAEAVLRYRESRRVAAGAATPQQYYRHRRLGRAGHHPHPGRRVLGDIQPVRVE